MPRASARMGALRAERLGRGGPSAIAALAAAVAAGGARPFLLESALADPELGRWSFLGFGPAAVVSGEDLDALERALAEAAPATDLPEGLPFAGGAVGYLSYDLGRRLERVRPGAAVEDQPFPALSFGIYEHVLALDARGEWIFAGLERGFERAREAALGVLERAVAGEGGRGAVPPSSPADGREGPEPGAPAPRRARRTFTREAYVRAVSRAIEYIRAGDIFEVNLSQRFEIETDEPAITLYRRLRARAAAPFCAFIEEADRAVLSLSPERFLSLRGREVETWPIKGTRPRGRNPAEDAALARELAASAKDRAELAMIVDLERNDLGRVAEAGSVRVRAAAELRTLPTVHHLVGRVAARLAEGRGAFDLVRATFPGGSITGAPKPRAMEIIDEIEPVRRSVYCGAIGYVGWGGDLDLSIAIRTALLSPAGRPRASACGSSTDGRRRLTFQAGGAVTAESDPVAEHEETIAKARAIAAAVGVDLEAESSGGTQS